MEERQRNLSVQRDHSIATITAAFWLNNSATSKRTGTQSSLDLVLGRIHSPAGENSELMHVRLWPVIWPESRKFSIDDVCFLIQPNDSYLQNYQSLRACLKLSHLQQSYDWVRHQLANCRRHSWIFIRRHFDCMGESFIYRLPADFAPARSHPSGIFCIGAGHSGRRCRNLRRHPQNAWKLSLSALRSRSGISERLVHRSQWTISSNGRRIFFGDLSLSDSGWSI